eukprot:CAMPEP_0202027824 /NCGR_PEP_ID=MMETSP0905-20130828/62479_1 /ASSEMBLY_ACC=CAM_ASM_000554 /TAXON_ID=420261 /ORGANISM="Thalassiosira antarctica, Strain CCMP982" /LENGTH=45 /DNA_ID= /DNA_START= /DNA_END= /DNA_ORIENTATION=
MTGPPPAAQTSMTNKNNRRPPSNHQDIYLTSHSRNLPTLAPLRHL